MLIQVNARARRGAVMAELRRLIRDDCYGVVAPEQLAVLSRGREAVGRYVAEAPAGSEVHVQITADQDAVGGWSATVLVNVTPARPRARRERRRA